MIQQSIIEILIVAFGMMGSQWYISEYYKPHLYIVSTPTFQLEHYYIHIHHKGNYFCPSYCGVDHKHIAHHEEYNCSTSCMHKIYVDVLERVKLPKSKRKKPKKLPITIEGDVIQYSTISQ